MDINRVKSVVLVIIGILAISLSIRCYTFNTYGSEPCKYYDSKGEEIPDYEESLSTGLASEADIQNVYTGIQNATADTSGNICNLEKIIKFGFGSVLLICGLVLITFSFSTIFVQKSNTNG